MKALFPLGCMVLAVVAACSPADEAAVPADAASPTGDAGCPSMAEPRVMYLPSGACGVSGQECRYCLMLECPNYHYPVQNPECHDAWRCSCQGNQWRCELTVRGGAVCAPWPPDAGIGDGPREAGDARIAETGADAGGEDGADESDCEVDDAPRDSAVDQFADGRD
jgi:hypothetical protein